ncbi:MAG: hypothetical protein KY468_21415, partial [Armatimonadetes bacterium]|nr:hypothetical protein [Armatimonadota bacterium]
TAGASAFVFLALDGFTGSLLEWVFAGVDSSGTAAGFIFLPEARVFNAVEAGESFHPAESFDTPEADGVDIVAALAEAFVGEDFVFPTLADAERIFVAASGVGGVDGEACERTGAGAGASTEDAEALLWRAFETASRITSFKAEVPLMVTSAAAAGDRRGRFFPLSLGVFGGAGNSSSKANCAVVAVLRVAIVIPTFI